MIWQALGELVWNDSRMFSRWNDVLLSLPQQEGAFLVRDCSRNTTNEPYVLAVFYENRVFNIQIRFCKETSKYTLGTRIKTNDVSL